MSKRGGLSGRSSLKLETPTFSSACFGPTRAFLLHLHFLCGRVPYLFQNLHYSATVHKPVIRMVPNEIRRFAIFSLED